MTAKRSLLIGLGAGVILGILYAPYKGSKTRKKISRTGGELRDGWNNLKNRVSNKLGTAAESMEEYPEENMNTSYL